MRASEIFQAHPMPLAQALPHPQTTIRAAISGFPSPTEDHVSRTPYLHRQLVKRPSATFSVTEDRVEGFAIQDGNPLMVDWSVTRELPI